MKILNLILSALFVAFAALQWNDPDPLHWIALYGSIAVISALAAFDRYSGWILLITMLFILFELFRLFPAFWNWFHSGMPSITGSMHAGTPYVEFVREFIGVAICFVAVLFHMLRYRRLRIARQKG